MASTKGPFRVNDWWKSKAAMLMGMVYVFVLWFAIPFEKFLILGGLSLATISGFAATGYLLNDFFDRTKDLQAGKENFLQNKPPLIILVFFAIAAALLFLPWLKLPFTNVSFILIFIEVFLLLIYSLPPVRLKEKGLYGVFTDALYAHTVPVLLAAYTFSLAADRPLTLLPVLLLGIWQTLMGVRNILIHQVDDAAMDLKAGNNSWVLQTGQSGFNQKVKNILLAEITASIIFFSILGWHQAMFFSVVFVILFIGIMATIRFREGGIQQMLESRSRSFPNAIYEKWMPATVLFALGFTNYYFWIILVLHVAVFSFETYVKTAEQGNIYGAKIYWKVERIPFRAPFSLLANHFIYYVFLIFGVNLKKENVSALDYLSGKRKHK